MSYNKTKYIDTDFPELVSLFVNKTNLHIPKSSKEKYDVKCPCCGKIYKMQVVNLVKSGHVTCPTCNDGFSYPEKFLANILNNLNIDYIYQFTPKWANGYRYDFLIKDNIIIEMDGGLGHGKICYVSYDIDKTKNIDKEKDILAQNNGYKIYRVDCDYKNNNKYNYIKNSIQNTLKSIIDTDNINWDLCNKNALSSLFYTVIDCYKTRSKYVNEISQLLNLKPRTVIKYLTEAMNNNIIEKRIIIRNNPFFNIPNDVKIISNDKHLGSLSKFVYSYDDKILFDSIKSASEYYDFPYETFLYNIKNHNCHNGKVFVCTKNINEIDFNNKPNINSYKLYQYNKNFKLIKIYNSPKDIPSNFNYGNIFRVITKQRKTAYGYIWSKTPIQVS